MFLRSIRARLKPEDFGISPGRRRRHRGLRQEDVAKLAGVSPRWYEAFERGRLRRRFSTAFVTRIAETLRLDPHERASLFRLALSEVAETVEHFERWAQHKEHPAAPHDGV
jgi:transcriptional regulator with XRE-family HTH domain